MPANFITVEVWVMVGADGQYVADTDAARLVDRWEEDCGEFSEVEGVRRVKLSVKVPLPEVIELTGEVAADEQPGELKAA